jgi:hypothetical protein
MNITSLLNKVGITTESDNLMKDADFLDYLEEHSVPEEETQIAFAEWIKENEDK